jgi:hypothetical protein
VWPADRGYGLRRWTRVSAPQLRAKSILSDIKSEQSARVVRPFLYPAPVRGLPTCIAAVSRGAASVGRNERFAAISTPR